MERTGQGTNHLFGEGPFAPIQVKTAFPEAEAEDGPSSLMHACMQIRWRSPLSPSRNAASARAPFGHPELLCPGREAQSFERGGGKTSRYRSPCPYAAPIHE